MGSVLPRGRPNYIFMKKLLSWTGISTARHIFRYSAADDLYLTHTADTETLAFEEAQWSFSGNEMGQSWFLIRSATSRWDLYSTQFFSSRSLLKRKNWHLGGASNSQKIPAAAENTNTNTNTAFNGISTVIDIFESSKIARALDVTDTAIGSHYLPSFSHSSALQPVCRLWPSQSPSSNVLSSLFPPSSSASGSNVQHPYKQHSPIYV